MAIAFDTNAEGSAVSTSVTYAHTCSGSDRILFVGVNVENATEIITGVTYNGVACTQINKRINADNDQWTYLYYLIAPATGANNVVISISSSRPLAGRSASYTGVLQSGQPDNNTTSRLESNGASLTNVITSVANNCWHVAMATENAGSNISAGTATTKRSATITGIFDGNAAITPAGSSTLTITHAGAKLVMCGATFSPSTASATKKNLMTLGVN
jgi:hypothetical protein